MYFGDYGRMGSLIRRSFFFFWILLSFMYVSIPFLIKGKGFVLVVTSLRTFCMFSVVDLVLRSPESRFWCCIKNEIVQGNKNKIVIP